MADATYGTGHAWWDVTIDGHLQTPALALHPGDGLHELASGLPLGTHTVELCKRTEASVSTTQLRGFEVSHGELLDPPPAASRRIEFLGDSVSTGYGVLGQGPRCAFSPATEDHHVAFPALVAEALGADRQNLAYSGRGVSWNLDRKDPDVFARHDAGAAVELWRIRPRRRLDHARRQRLGPASPGRPAPGARHVRGRLRSPHRDCAAGPSGLADRLRHRSVAERRLPLGAALKMLTRMRAALGDVVARAPGRGDSRVLTFEFSRAGEGDLTGCGYHPNAHEQSSLAREATAFLRMRLGWNQRPVP